MRLLGISRIVVSTLSLSLAVLLVGCLPPTADRNSPDNSTSIDPALAFDNPAGDAAAAGNPTWGGRQFPLQPVEEFLTPVKPPDEGDSVSPGDPLEEPLPDLDLDLTLGVGELDLEPPEIDVDLGPDSVEAKADHVTGEPPVDRNHLDDLYPDVSLPDKTEN